MVPPIVSIVIPTYERNDILFARAIPSIRGQSYQDFEVHIVADGMTGPPAAELDARVGALGDPRFKVWHIPRQTYPEDPGQKWCVLGLNARNHGLDHAQGDWIAGLDDDDEWTLDHIEVLLNQALREGVDASYGKSKYHWPDEHPQEAGSWPPGHGAFCDGAQLYRNGMGYRYDPDCLVRGLPEDGDLWDRMVAGGVTFSFLPRIVHHYYPNPR